MSGSSSGYGGDSSDETITTSSFYVVLSIRRTVALEVVQQGQAVNFRPHSQNKTAQRLLISLDEGRGGVP